MASDTPPLDDESRQERNQNQVQFLWDVLQRHWTMIVLFIWLGAGAGLVVGYLLHDERRDYTAVSVLAVRPSLYDQSWMESVGGSLFGPMTPRSIVERTSVQALAEDVARALSQEDIVNGDPLSRLTTVDEYSGKAGKLGGLIGLEAHDDLGTVVVSAQGHTPREAERLAESASRVLIEQSQHVLWNEQETAHATVKQELEELRHQLDAAENAQWAYRESIGFQTHEQVWDDLERKTAEVREAWVTREELEARLAEVDSAIAANRAELPATLGSVSASTIERLKSELDELLGEKAELQVIYQPGAPVLTPLEELDDLIRDKREAILIAIRELGGGAGDGFGSWEQQKELYAKKAAIEFQLSDLDIRIRTLDKIMGELEAQLPLLADKRFEYQQLVHTTDQIRNRFGRMLAKEFELKTAQGRGSGTLERRDAVAVFPSEGGGSAPIWVTILMGTGIGLVIAFALSMLIESMDTSIRGPEDVAQYIGLEVLGTIPLMKLGRPRKRRWGGRRKEGAAAREELEACIVTRIDPKSPISEAYRSLRTNFQFATLRGKPKTVMVTSAVPGEGKTTTAVNFAVTMADRGIRVLVVDTDLRRPHVHRVLRMERGKGLADVVREQIPIKEVVRPTPVENLWMVTSGRVPPNPSELIGSDRMKQLITELGQGFDLVVCDAPSLHVVTDPVLLATHVDTVLLVISVNNARRETIQRAKKFLETANPHIAGVVLNGLEATRRHYYYYYYYYENAPRATPARAAWFQRL